MAKTYALNMLGPTKGCLRNEPSVSCYYLADTARRDIVEQCKAESEVQRRRKDDDVKTNAEHKLIEELS